MKLSRIQEAIDAAKFTRASFSSLRPALDRAAFNDTDNRYWNTDYPLPKTEAEVTEFIKRRTDLYMRSWVLPVLEELIEEKQRKPKAQR